MSEFKKDDHLEHLAEFLYLSFKQTMWEQGVIMPVWDEREPFAHDAWLAVANTAEDYFDLHPVSFRPLGVKLKKEDTNTNNPYRSNIL